MLGSIGAYANGFKLVTSTPLEESNVKGRQGLLIKQKLSFGNYYTTSVKRGAFKSHTMMSGFPGFIWTEHMEGKQNIRFKLTDGIQSSEVFCATNVSSRDLVIGSNPNAAPNVITSVLRIGTEHQQNNFSVAIYTEANEQPWELFLDNTNSQLHRKDYIGYVTRGEEYYTIVPVWKIEKKNGKVAEMPFGSAGFEIQNAAGEAIAAVSLIDQGKVYMGAANEKERFLMANVCSALLLQSEL